MYLVQCYSLGIYPEEDTKIFRLFREWDKNDYNLEEQLSLTQLKDMSMLDQT